MKIIPLSEGSFTIDGTKMFVPFDEEVNDLQERPRGSLLVEVQPFAVLRNDDVLLLDTGLGFGKNGKMQLHQNLEAAGISVDRVTHVLLTHLHKDHAGGVSLPDDHSQFSFPNATYYVNEKELEFAFTKGEPSFIREDLEVLRNSPRVVLTDNEGTIDGYIHYEHSGAHSPHHQVFWIRDKGETIFFGGDEAPTLQQMKHRFVAKYDHDGKKAAELRKKWWEQGKQEGWSFLFYHDIGHAVVKS